MASLVDREANQTVFETNLRILEKKTLLVNIDKVFETNAKVSI